MDTKTADALIRQLWEIGEKLKTVQSNLDAVENAIADMVEDDG
tara:strand:- start:310 stop:438 length:129 start_codon:yes stop_codon:yes gene_type:complete